MTVLVWILIVSGAYLIVLNYRALATNHANRRKGIDWHHSFIPLLGGTLLAVGAYLLLQHSLAFAVAALDPGIWVMAWLPVALLRQKMRKAK